MNFIRGTLSIGIIISCMLNCVDIDIEMIMMYQDYIRTANKPKGNNSTIDRKMGRLGNINDVKEILEKIFKST